MKKKIYPLLLVGCGLIAACTETWDDYYNSSTISKNPTDDIEEIENVTVMEFFDEHAEYNDFFNLLGSVGITEELKNSGQEFTLWTVNNSNIATEAEKSETPLESDTARLRYHVNYLSMTKDQLTDGKRLKTLNGTYIQITNNEGGLLANDIKVLKSYRLNNGVVYEIEELMEPRINLYNYIKSLDDSYSIFRDSIMNRSRMVYDTARSTPTGVDETGNIIYDWVEVEYNPLFDTARINSEYLQFTCFLPDNEVMKNCFDKLNATYTGIGRPLNESVEGDSLYTGYDHLFPQDLTMAVNWIQRAVLYEGLLEPEATQEKDIYSIFKKQWKNIDRTGAPVQIVEGSVPYEEGSSFPYKKLSNGRVYKVKDLKIPNNVIISRLKQYAYHIGYRDKNDPAQQIFVCVKNNADDKTYPKIATDAAVVSPVVAAGYPSDAWSEYTYTYFNENEKGEPVYTYIDVRGKEEPTEFSISFTPLQPTAMKTTGAISEYKIPAGEYTLCMGFRSTDCCTGDVLFGTAQTDDNGNLQKDPADADGDVLLKSGYSLVRGGIDFTASTPWNFDRSGTGGQDKYMQRNGRKWNSDGGTVGTVEVEGDPGTMQSVRIKVKYVTGSKRIELFHWCLKPTENNY